MTYTACERSWILPTRCKNTATALGSPTTEQFSVWYKFQFNIDHQVQPPSRHVDTIMFVNGDPRRRCRPENRRVL